MSKREAGTIFISLQLGTEQLRAGFRSLDTQLKKIGQSAQHAGARMSLAFTAPLALMARSAVQSFGNFNQAMTNSIAFMGEAGEALRTELGDAALEMGAKTEHGSAAAAEALGELAKAGLSAGSAIAALPVIADFATAGQMKMAEATTTLVQIQKALGLALEDASPEENALALADVADVIGRAALDTTLSIQDLSSSLASQLGGSLRSANVDIETATALLEGFGVQGIKGAKAGTYLSIIIRELGIDFLKYSDAYKKLGIAVFDDQGQYRNVLSIIQDIEKTIGNLAPIQQVAALGTLGFTKKNIAAIKSLIGMGDAMQYYRDRNKGAQGEIAQIAEKMRTGFNFQMQIAKNNLENVAIAIGSDLAPLLLRLVQLLAEAAKWFIELPKAVKIATYIFAGLLAVVGPLVFIFGSLVTAIGAIGTTIGVLASWGTAIVGALTGAVAAVNVFTIAFLAMPVLIGGALIAGAAAIYVFWDDIKKAAQDFVDWLDTTFPNISIVLQAGWIVALEAAQLFWDSLVEFGEIAVDSMTTVGNVIGEVLFACWELAWKAASEYWTRLTNRVNEYINFFVKAAKTIGNLAASMWDEIRGTTVGQIADESVNIILDSIGGALKMGVDAAQGLVGASENVVEHAKVQKQLAASLEETAKAQQKANFEALTASIVGKEYSGAIKDLNDHLTPVREQLGPTKVAFKELKEEQKEHVNVTEETLKGLKGTGEEANKAAKAMDSLNKKLAEAKASTLGKDLKEQLGDAIERFDKVGFERIREELANAVREGAEEGLDDLAKKAGAGGAAIVSEIGKAKAEAAINQANADWEEASKKRAEKMKEDEIQAHTEAVEFWQKIFSDATSKGAFDLKQSLTDLAIGFASELAAAISGSMKGVPATMMEAGGALGRGAASLFGSAGFADMFGGMGGGNTFGASGYGENPEGFYGPGGDPSGSGAGQAPTGAGFDFAGAMQAGAQVFSDWQNASETDKAHGDNRGTGAAAGGTAGAAIGGIFGGEGGAAIGQQIGSVFGGIVGSFFGRGSKDPDEKARKAFSGFIEDSFDKLKTIAFFDANQKLKVMNSQDLNFLQGGRDKFNDGEWATKINSLGSTARNTFLGLGEAMKEVLGITEDVGGQLGFLLAENLGGNIDNARLFVQQLGLSMEDMMTKLVESGKTGAMSWLEVESAIQGVTEAFKPGLVAVGDIGGAFQELVESGGRGVAALKAVRDIAVEAMEAGAKTLDDLKNRLLADGVDPKDVEALMASLQQRGVTTLEQLAEVSDRVGGGIVADMNAMSESMAKTWEDMGKQLEDVTQKLKDLPAEIQSNITLNVKTNIDEDGRALIDSGLGQVELPESDIDPDSLTPETSASVPTNGTAVRSLRRGRRAGGGDINIYVDAQGATPGMEAKIVDALRRSQSQVISQTIDAIDRRDGRGGRDG